jgi:hypothetical protein
MYFPSPDGTRHVLVWSSPNLGTSLWMSGTEVVNATGTYFVPDVTGPVDSGLAYASKVALTRLQTILLFEFLLCNLQGFEDDTGRWVLFSWLPEQRPLTNITRPGIQ